MILVYIIVYLIFVWQVHQRHLQWIGEVDEQAATAYVVLAIGDIEVETLQVDTTSKW